MAKITKDQLDQIPYLDQGAVGCCSFALSREVGGTR